MRGEWGLGNASTGGWRHDVVMRTTLDIDEAVLSAARAKAHADGTSVGKALSALARQALDANAFVSAADGFPILDGIPGHPVTNDLVALYGDDE